MPCLSEREWRVSLLHLHFSCTLGADSRLSIDCLSTQCQPMIGRQSPEHRLSVSSFIYVANLAELTLGPKKSTSLFKQKLTKVNFHKVRLTGSAFNPYARPDEMHTWSCSKYLALEFYATELLSWGKSGKYRNELPYELSFCRCLPTPTCTSVSYSSLFCRTCQ